MVQPINLYGHEIITQGHETITQDHRIKHIDYGRYTVPKEGEAKWPVALKCFMASGSGFAYVFPLPNLDQGTKRRQSAHLTSLDSLRFRYSYWCDHIEQSGGKVELCI